MNAALNGVQRNGVVCRVGGEDCDGVARRESVNGRLVGVGILLVVGGEAVKVGGQAIVDLGNVLVKVFACVCLLVSRATCEDVVMRGTYE